MSQPSDDESLLSDSDKAILKESLEYFNKFARRDRVECREEGGARAIDVAAGYLRTAAIARARELMASPAIQVDDCLIAEVEKVLRAARHMHRIDNHDGDTIPSVELPGGAKVPLVTRLIEKVGRELVLQANLHDDPKSRSNKHKAIREAREKVRAAASAILREGEIAS